MGQAGSIKENVKNVFPLRRRGGRILGIHENVNGSAQSSLTFDNKNHVTNGGFAYDAAGSGNMTSDSFSLFTWDAVGWRVRKTTGTGSVQYLFDTAGHVTEELTTDFGTSVNLHRTDHGFDDAAGDIFVAMGRHHVNLKWIDAGHLSIQCQDCSRKQVSKAVTILG